MSLPGELSSAVRRISSALVGLPRDMKVLDKCAKRKAGRGGTSVHSTANALSTIYPVVHTYRAFHNEHRPHQGIGNRVPRAVRTGEAAPEVLSGPISTVHCEESLGGLLKSYRRAAA